MLLPEIFPISRPVPAPCAAEPFISDGFEKRPALCAGHQYRSVVLSADKLCRAWMVGLVVAVVAAIAKPLRRQNVPRQVIHSLSQIIASLQKSISKTARASDLD